VLCGLFSVYQLQFCINDFVIAIFTLPKASWKKNNCINSVCPMCCFQSLCQTSQLVAENWIASSFDAMAEL